jgi:hypothetical protein
MKEQSNEQTNCDTSFASPANKDAPAATTATDPTAAHTNAAV